VRGSSLTGSIVVKHIAHRFLIAFGTTAVLLILMPYAHGDTWRGTAPFCAGSCLRGEVQIGISDTGGGGYCVTGHKVLCRNSEPTCPVRQTNFDCYGAVKVCDNGYYEAPSSAWRSCGTYVCGLCLGLDSLTTSGRSAHHDICKQGFVWREAIKNDHVCVTPQMRDQARRDNNMAASRREPNGGAYGKDTCKPGFVWRDVVPTVDHVCVTPVVRAAAAIDNKKARERIAGN
jgi:hypothetical protein